MAIQQDEYFFTHTKNKRFIYRHEIDIAETTKQICDENNFEVRAFKFDARHEDCRPPQIVRVAAVQHSIVLPTTAKREAQLDALLVKIEKFIQAAAASNVNIICFPEAWSESTKTKINGLSRTTIVINEFTFSRRYTIRIGDTGYQTVDRLQRKCRKWSHHTVSHEGLHRPSKFNVHLSV